MESYIVDWLSLMVRWAHFIVGVAWIGASFYFIWLDNHLEPPKSPADVEKGVGGELWAVHLIREAEEMVRPNLERRNITLEINFGPVLPHLFIDDDMIRRVMINLLDNALKFSSDGKKITLDAAYKPEANHVLISISDQGVGIAEQFRQSVFDKFHRVQAQGGPKGLGLGLAFCRLAVEAHGGRIWVDESESGGARFNFVLPTSSEGS
jgi:signal transduction histidine kinase